MVVVTKRTEIYLFAQDLCIWCYKRYRRFRYRILGEFMPCRKKGGETNREVGKKQEVNVSF